MSDERSVVQFSGCDGVSYVDNGTVLFDKAVLKGKRLFFQNDLLKKVGIFFTVGRVDPPQIKIGAAVQKFAFFDAKKFTQIVAGEIQMNRGCQYILMKAADLMIKYFFRIA